MSHSSCSCFFKRQLIPQSVHIRWRVAIDQEQSAGRGQTHCVSALLYVITVRRGLSLPLVGLMLAFVLLSPQGIKVSEADRRI